MNNDTQKLWEKAIQLLTEEKWDEAIADLSQFIEATNDAAAYVNRGYAYNEKNEYDLALADYNKAIELKPNYENVYNNRGSAYKGKGEYDKALADYNKAIELNPNYAEAYNNRGNVYSDKGEYDKALADYNKAIELNPNYAEAYNNRGSAYQSKGEYDKALADYNKAIKLNPNFKEAIHNRAATLVLRELKKEQGEITLKYQEQIEKQRQDFDKEFKILHKQYQKEFEDIVETLDYEKIIKEYDDDLKTKNKYLRNLFVSLGAIAIVAYGGVFYIVYPIKAGVSSFIVFPYVILATLVLSPLVWWIRIVVRDKYKIWALREDARSKRVLTMITRFAKGDYKEVILKLLEYHGTNSSANLVLDGQREAKSGGENIVNIIRDATKKDEGQ